MSAKLMGQIYDLDLKRGPRDVLMAMADHADHQGRNVMPGVDLIAWKTGYSSRQVRRHQDALRELGALVIEQDRRAAGLPYVYRIEIDHLPRKAPLGAEDETTGQNVQ